MQAVVLDPGGALPAQFERAFERSANEAAKRGWVPRLEGSGSGSIRDGSPELAKIRMTELLADSMNDVRQYLKQRDAAREPAAP